MQSSSRSRVTPLLKYPYPEREILQGQIGLAVSTESLEDLTCRGGTPLR